MGRSCHDAVSRGSGGGAVSDVAKPRPHLGGEGSIRVLIADDHSVIRTGLKTLLASDPDLAVVGEAASGGETYRLVAELEPDVVLLDIGMPGEDGIEIAKKLKASFPRISVLFLTMHEDDELMCGAIEAGAAGYIIKRAEEREILEAVHVVHRGDLYVHPGMTRALVEHHRADVGARKPGAGPLTPRELEVLAQIAEGAGNREIGRRLRIAERTVKAHVTSVFNKLGAANRAQAVAVAARRGILAHG